MEKKVSFKSYDGTQLVGIVCVPDNCEVSGAFLLMHGIPSEKDEWGFYRDMAATLAQRNYASFRFDFRCNGESDGGDVANISLSGLINDIESAFYTLTQYVDVGIPLYAVGTSCGGGVTVKWANTFGHSIKKIFLMAPVLDYNYEIFGEDFPEYADPSAIIPDKLQQLLLSDGHIDSEIHYGLAMVNEAHLFSAADEFKKLRVPVAIYQGDSDTVVPYSKTLRIAEDFSDRVKLTTIHGADHGFAVDGDDDLTAPGTKQNHLFVYSEILKEILV